jgi:hypothetical protein
MESSKNIQRKDSECDGVVQKYTKKRQWVWWSRPKIYQEKTVSVMESSKDIQRKDSECDGVVQRSWLIWCIKWMVCYHELTYTTEDSGVLTIVAFLWCCIIAQLMISALKRCLVRLYLHLLVGGHMFYLHYLCYLRIVVSNTSCGVQHVMWCLTRIVVSNTYCGV